MDHQSQIAEYLADNYLHGDTELANAFAKRILDAEARSDYHDMLGTIEAARTLCISPGYQTWKQSLRNMIEQEKDDEDQLQW